MNAIDDTTLDVLAAQATDPDHETQDRADAAAVLGELVAGDVWAAERIAAALARIGSTGQRLTLRPGRVRSSMATTRRSAP